MLPLALINNGMIISPAPNWQEYGEGGNLEVNFDRQRMILSRHKHNKQIKDKPKTN